MTMKAESSEADGSTLRVLIVEDHSNQRKQLALALERLGFEVLQAKDSAEALGRMEEGVPKTVIIDHILDDEMDGIDLAATIRSRFPGTSLIFTSGKLPTKEEEKKAQENGISLEDRWLEKPLRIDKLSTTIGKGLETNFSTSSAESIREAIEKVYAEMRALIVNNGGNPGLREALIPLRDKLRGFQAQEAELIARRYEDHFGPLYERGQDLIRRARQLLEGE